MTMMMTDLQFGLGDMEALLWGPSSPTADPPGALDARSHPAEEPQHPGPEDGPLSFFASSLPSSYSSPPSSSSSSLSSASSSAASPPAFYSPPASPPHHLLAPPRGGDKPGLGPDVLSLPWLAPPSPRLGGVGTEAAGGKGDAFCDLDWMTERMDLSEFDLDSLIGSCSADDDDSPSSPEALLASLDALPPPPPPQPPASLSPAPFVTSPPAAALEADLWAPASPPPCVPEALEELEIKSEPDSPAASPAYTLDLGSEVDVVDCEVKESEAKPSPTPAAGPAPAVPRIILSLSPTRIVLLLAPKDPVTTTTTVSALPAAQQSSSSSSSRPAPPPPPPARSRPYPDPGLLLSPSGRGLRSARGSSAAAAGDTGRSCGGGRPSKAPKDKKLKKMEQNKTAATRYRQKKRVEQESLSTVYANLERRNIELNEKADSMAREIQYLKELMEEVRAARLRSGQGVDL